MALTFKGMHAGPVALAAAQAITGAWADLGAVQEITGAASVAVWIELDINDSTDVRIRLLALHTAGGTEYVLPIETTGTSDTAVEDEYIEFEDDADQNMVIGWELRGVVRLVQVQVMAGAVGVAAGAITVATMTTGRY